MHSSFRQFMEVSADFSEQKLLLVSFRREARSAAEPVGIRRLPPATNQIITNQLLKTSEVNQLC
jgi:hypothetical protein